MPRNPYDRVVPAGQAPFKSMDVMNPANASFGGPSWLDNLLGMLGIPVRVINEPFRYWIALEFALPAGDSWIDRNFYLQGRRAFAVVNTDTVVGNDIWINSKAMSAAAGGGRIFANGGVFSAPIGYGADQQQVHCFPLVAGSTVSFYQFA